MKRDWLPTLPTHLLLQASGLRAIHEHLLERFRSSGDELLARLKQSGWLEPGDRVLDIDGRVGTLAQVLLDEPIASYVGIERTADVVDWYRDEVSRRDPRFTFHRLDEVIAALDGGAHEALAPQAYDLVVVNAILTQESLAMIQKTLVGLSIVLAPEGRAVLNAHFAVGESYFHPGRSFLGRKDLERRLADLGLRAEFDDEPFTGPIENWFLVRRVGASAQA